MKHSLQISLLLLFVQFLSLQPNFCCQATTDVGQNQQQLLGNFLQSGISVMPASAKKAPIVTMNDTGANGNLYEANIGFEVIASPNTILTVVDGPSQTAADSASLNAQRQQFKQYLKTHDVAYSQQNVVSGNNLQYTSSSAANSSNSSIASSRKINKARNDDGLDEIIEAVQETESLPFLGKDEEEEQSETTESPHEESTETEAKGKTIKNTTAESFIQRRLSEGNKLPAGGAFLEEKSTDKTRLSDYDLKGTKAHAFSFKRTLSIIPQAFIAEDQDTPNITQILQSDNSTASKKVVYEGNASQYMNNTNYEIVSEQVVVVDSDTEEVILTVEARMEPLSSLYSVLYMTLIACFILMSIQFKNWIYKFFQEDLLGGLNSILRDNIVLMFVAMTLKVIDHHYKPDLYVSITGLSLGLLLFAFLWAVLGVFMAIITKFYIEGWKVYEDNFSNREKIFREFEDLYLEPSRTKAQQNEFIKKKLELEYFLMRQEFISPTFLPVVGEDFLRDDFDFAYYLGGCMAKSSAHSFRYAISTIWAVLFSMLIYTIVYYISKKHTSVCILLIPLIVLIVMVRLEIKMTDIYSQIVNIVYSPYDVNFTKFESLRQPLVNLGRINLPRYLQGEAPPSSQFKRWIKSLTTPNRHELLFWFATPRFVVRFIHFVLVGQMVWMVWFWLQDFHNITGWVTIVISVVAWILTFVNLFLLTPRVLRTYCIISNIQMLKDREMIRTVNEKAMAERSHLMMSLYRFLKAIDRASQRDAKVEDPEAASKLREYAIKLVSENFEILNNGDATVKAIKLAQLYKFARLCGRPLSEEEITYLGHGIVKGSSEEIYLADVMDHIKRVLGEVSKDPAKTTTEVLRHLLKKDRMTPIMDLKKIIASTEMLDEELSEKILKEIRYLPLKNAEISIEMIGTLIRDSIEEFPR